MIQEGTQACFLRDRKGYLPIHVACSRHCSPEKLQMLLEVNPNSLHDTTKDGASLLDLAIKTATKSHPNYALIDDLRRRLHLSGEGPYISPNRVSSSDTSDDTHSTSECSPANHAIITTVPSRREHPITRDRKRKRKVAADDEEETMIDDDKEQANLLLQFSRQTHNEIQNFASV